MTKKLLFLICLLSLVLSAEIVWGATLYVDSTRQESGTGENWEEAFQTIQEAVEAASGAGDDEIWVAGGVEAAGMSRYYRLSVPIYIDKPVAIYGGFAGTETDRDQRDWEANETTVDGQNSVRCFDVRGDCAIDGFIIMGGSSEIGAGIFSEQSVFSVANCTFTDNRAVSYGGGMYNSFGQPTIIDCIFSGNSAGEHGGAIFNLYCIETSIVDCVFGANEASTFGGGGIFDLHGSNPLIANCLFTGNIAGAGGAICVYQSAPQITNCTLTNNSAIDTGEDGDDLDIGYGGGIYAFASSLALTNSIL